MTSNTPMQSWILESLRRAIIAGAFIAVAHINIQWLRVSAIVAFGVFMFFLLRNPEHWLRRLSYLCVSLGAAILVKLGTAIAATGWFQYKTDNVIGGILLKVQEGSSSVGVILLGAGSILALLDLLRMHMLSRKSNMGTSQPAPMVFPAKYESDLNFSVVSIVPIQNTKSHEISIGKATLSRFGLLDRILVRAIRVSSATTLELVKCGKGQEEVEFSKSDPLVWGEKSWKRFKVKFKFKDKIGTPTIYLTPIYWFLGIRRRSFYLNLGSGEGETTIKYPITVHI